MESAEHIHDPWMRTRSLETSRGERVTAEVIDDMGKVPKGDQEYYAAVIEAIAGNEDLTREAIREQFNNKERRHYFIKNSKGHFVTYGIVDVNVEEGKQVAYIAKIVTDLPMERRGYGGAMLDAILADGYDRVWAFNMIGNTPAGKAFREAHVRKGFKVSYGKSLNDDSVQEGTPPNLIWDKPV